MDIRWLVRPHLVAQRSASSASALSPLHLSANNSILPAFFTRNLSKLWLGPLEQLPMKHRRLCISNTTSPQLHPCSLLFNSLQQHRSLAFCTALQKS